ncbi:MAG: hypothetical protein QM778_02090 [Myxococcales bacterium]
MKKLVIALCIVGTLAGLARAEPIHAPKPVEYGFDDELVSGDLVRSDSEFIPVRRRSVRASLVEVRTSYVPELLKSVEDL